MMKKMDFVTEDELSRECARIFVEGLRAKVKRSEENVRAEDEADVA
jgi:hypothetical protein